MKPNSISVLFSDMPNGVVEAHRESGGDVMLGCNSRLPDQYEVHKVLLDLANTNTTHWEEKVTVV